MMGKVRDFVVWAAVAAALGMPLYFVVAAFGTKLGLFDWLFGFVQMTVKWGPNVIMGVLAFAALALLLAIFIPPRRGVPLAVLALLIPAGGLGYGAYVRSQAGGIPPIHDISTDLIDPPGFSEGVVALRVKVHAGNGLDLLTKTTKDGRSFVEIEREAYGDIQSIPCGLPEGAAFDVALALTREQPWKIGVTDRASGRIEAVAESFWFGFKDDVVIRVRSDGQGSRVDMRSVSRVGGSDLGANAARMRPFLATLRERLSAAEAQAAPTSM